jgi:hypothetical protein
LFDHPVGGVDDFCGTIGRAIAGFNLMKRANGIYKVTQFLPLEGEDYQYRIKSANEPHKRIAKKASLVAFNDCRTGALGCTEGGKMMSGDCPEQTCAGHSLAGEVTSA